ncbi:MAG: peptidase [Gammaproteobacteria bacterium RIFCSPHIGHO2_02_FULL_42_13]|nr:MAG: peptidase [Gammaproteobacteria bacterium RIFCSPHIGHO2_02_FULL_42_13]OGT68644.1 MAG: peptidase [Gammaproteobacteria bacterium RIFCSPLOWO2_02_FULL_42_9]
MGLMQLNIMQSIAIWSLPVLFAVTIHEVAHGWVASKAGDKTAQFLGRVTINPFKHIDLIGTIVVPLALLYLGGFMFGWAKPVPINPRNFRHPRRDIIWVSLAGPVSNFLMAFVWGGIGFAGKLFVAQGMPNLYPIILMGQAGIIINCILGVLNLIPLPPLDGAKIVSSLLPGKMAYQYDRIEPYGFYILVLLIVTGVLSMLLSPAMQLINILFNLFGLY